MSELWREILHVDSGLIHPFRVDSCEVEWKSALDQLAAFTQLKDVRFCGGLLEESNLFSLCSAATPAANDGFHPVES